MNQKVIIGIIAVVIIIAGIVVYTANNNSQNNNIAGTEQGKESMMKDRTEDQPANSNNTNQADKTTDDKMMSEDSMMMKKSGSYKDYSPATVETEQKSGNKVVLFFHAPWCPECRAADAAFKAALDKIPAGVTILKTDYDSNSELKTKYGVTYQHTFVQIDNNEALLTKWNGGDINALQKNLK